jgi:uncharacterized protein YuzE
MRISYHQDTDSLYIHFSDTPSVESEEVGPNVVVDFAADGAIVGLEVDHASAVMDLTRIETTSVPVGLP